jgi:glycosyltransferase involved in cell wall biosynthesis
MSSSGMKTIPFQICIRLVMLVYIGCLRLAKLLQRFPGRPPKDGLYDILLTGTFYSDNWIKPHLTPLAGSVYVKKVRMVATVPVPQIDNVEAIYPPQLLCRMAGKTLGRILMFTWVALRDRPHIVGGFHMLPNGLVAVLVAKLIRAKSIYFCGGGPREIQGGGYMGNPVFARLQKPDPIIERFLFEAVASVNLVITMGHGAIEFFKKQADTKYYVMPGGFEVEKYFPAHQEPENDLILVGRLSEVKRVDIFLQAIVIAKETLPNISAIVVGGGPLLTELQEMAKCLSLEKNVHFVGHQNNVEDWLRRSKIFVLTSDSEGVSQAMIQAMLCGLPPVVSDVGDLAEVVSDGVNGFLVARRDSVAFAECFSTLLNDQQKLVNFGKASLATVASYKMNNVACSWDDILFHLAKTYK